MEKKLYRSRTDKKLAGVCAGVAKYFGIDSTIVRLLWALAILFVGCGLWLYIICAFIIPEEPVDIIDA